MPETEFDLGKGLTGPSRSQKKRDAGAITELGERLVRLSAAELDQLALDDELRDAVGGAQSMQRTALARQLRLIGKLLRARDHEAIADQLQHVGQLSGSALRMNKQLQQWRDRLLAGGDAELAALVTEYPMADRQALRQLLRRARQDSADPHTTSTRAKRARRELWRRLDELLGSSAVPSG